MKRFLLTWMSGILLLFLAGSTAALLSQSAGQTKAAMPPGGSRLISVKATGTKRFTSEEVAAACGLPLGTVAREEDFQKAARQLGESGAFSNIAFTFSFTSAGTKLEFQLTDAEKFVPARFTDFVWFSDEELRHKVHQRIPLYNGELPATGRLTDEVSDVLQAMLVENAIPGHVEYLRKNGKDGHVEAVEYNVAGVSIRIRQAEFPGAGPGELHALEAAAEQISGREYSREYMHNFVERSLMPVYHERGYLQATFAIPQPKVVKVADAETPNGGPPPSFVDVIFPVTPGMQYKLAGVDWSGNKALPTETLQPLLHVRTGELANTVRLGQDLKAVQELYGSRGYILASVKVDAHFDDAAGSVKLILAVDEGAVFHMGELEFRGIDNNLTARLRAAWKIRPGDVYDTTYLQQFLPQAQKLLPANMDWQVDPHVTAIARDKTVDVDLQYTAKAPR